MKTIGDILKRHGSQRQLTEIQPQERAYSAGGVIRQNVAQRELAQRATESARRSAVAGEQELASMQQQQLGRQLGREDELQQMEQSRLLKKRDFENKSADVVRDLERRMGQLDEADRMDRMEAATSALRLADEKYNYSLADIGRRKRLDDTFQRDYALKEAIFEGEYDLLQDNMEFSKMLDMDDAEFMKKMADIDVEFALQVAAGARSAANQRAVIAGTSTLAREIGGRLAEGE